MPKIKFIDLKYTTDGDGQQHIDPMSIPDEYAKDERQRIEQCGQRRRGFLRIWNGDLGIYAPAEIMSPSIENLRSISSEIAPILDKLYQVNTCTCAELYHDFSMLRESALLDTTISEKERDRRVRRAEKELKRWGDHVPSSEDVLTHARCPSCQKAFQKSFWQILREEQDAVQRILYLLFGGEMDLLDLPYALNYLETWLFQIVEDPLSKKNLSTLTLGMLGIHQLLQWWTARKQQILANLLPSTKTETSKISSPDAMPITENAGGSPPNKLTLDSPPSSEISIT